MLCLIPSKVNCWQIKDAAKRLFQILCCNLELIILNCAYKAKCIQPLNIRVIQGLTPQVVALHFVDVCKNALVNKRKIALGGTCECLFIDMSQL